MEIICLLSKILQDNDLLSPELFTAILNSRKSIKKIQKLLRESDEIVIPDREVRSREGNSHRNSSIQGFQLRGSLENAIEQTKDQMVTILGALVDIYDTRFADIIENPIYKAASVFLDTSSYTEVGESIIVSNMQEIVDKFHRHLDSNGCKFDRLERELNIVLTHVGTFLKHFSPRNAWLALFKKGKVLGISNLLLVAELCIIFPLGNAEFSFLWRVFFAKNIVL